MNKIIGIITITLLLPILWIRSEELPRGEGSFFFTFNNGEFTDTLQVFYYIPEQSNQGAMPVVVGFHGNDRDCSYWIDTWKEYADSQGFMFFIPWFTKEKFPTWRYQEVGIRNEKGDFMPQHNRTTALVDTLLARIIDYSGSEDRKVSIYGHSAGGQFVHRFMMLNDSPYVKKAIIGNPGWFTFPTLEEEYSYGIKDLPEIDDRRLKSMLGKNVILQLGLLDTERESFLRKTPEADRQGLNRLERGNNFFEALYDKAVELNTDFNWRRVYVAETGHDAVAMSRHAAENLLNDSVCILIPGESPVKMSSNWLHRYDDEIAALVSKSDLDTDTICDALFIGSSSIRLWPDLEMVMKPLCVKNRGYGGAMMRDLKLNYRRLMAHYKPRAIVLYCDNDICGWEEGDLSVNQLFSLYKSFIDKLHEDYPQTKVYFLSIKHSLSRKNLRTSQENLNNLMRSYAGNDERLEYVDVTSCLLDENGEINDKLFKNDHLHLNSNGYALWNEILKPLLVRNSKHDQ